MPDDDMTLSVVVPVYNSEDIILELHQQLTKILRSLSGDYEIIFVNDCSPDYSWEKLAGLADSDPHVRAVSLRKNVGYDNAIMAGLKLANHSFIVIMDDDLQHSPDDIPILLSEIRKDYDIVYANFPRKHQSLLKNLGSWLNGKLAELIINKPPHIYLSPFKIIRKEIVDEIIRYGGPFPYVDGLFFQVTSSIHQVPLKHHARAEGKGNHGLYRSLKIVFNFCTTFSILPLRIAIFMGIAISFVAMLFSFGLILWKLWFGLDVEGWASIILGILVMGGIQLTGLGILGEYIGRAYMNLNQRPQYVIKEIRTSRSHSSINNDTTNRKESFKQDS